MEEKKRGAERTQPATRDEFWTDERIRSFLDMLPPEGVPADYHVLLKAYRGMLPDAFARFVPFFVEAGRDINVRLADGSTFLDHLAPHRKAGPYREVLEASGAVRSRQP
ncbi:MAG: PA4642 family protein [Pseudomonadales bacterium]|nr:PA4642 family protein [Pseudomonadales bacterium]MCP5330564.1 PA4642 family protein [Pseudomonadales bacterium]MCP5344191.1 PA4642 family protein [Pseudomonadales bacterium]